MTYQLATAKVWDGSAWVPAVGGGKTGQDLIVGWASDFSAATPVGTVGGTGTVIAASSSAHTFGAWTQIYASTGYDVAVIVVQVGTATAGQASGSVVEVGVGASGAESAIAQYACGSHAAWVAIPVRVAAGSRISARLQSVVTGGKTGVVYMSLVPQIGDFAGSSSTDAYGVDLATSRGVNLSASNVWTEITASTTRAYRALSFTLSASNDTQLNQNAIAEIATGASGSETRIGGYRFRTNVNENLLTDQGPVPFLYVGDVPAGTRLAVRQNSAQTYFDACVIGIPYL